MSAPPDTSTINIGRRGYLRVELLNSSNNNQAMIKMVRTRIDRLQGVECGGYVPASVHPVVKSILLQLNLAPPPKHHAIPMAVLDAALVGRSIQDRIEIKAHLRAHSLIN